MTPNTVPVNPDATITMIDARAAAQATGVNQPAAAPVAALQG